MWKNQSHLDHLKTLVVFGLAYWASFEISKDLHLINDFAKGISLVYLPAGVKMVAALVGGFWGVLGTVLALMVLAHQNWADQPLVFMVLTACISGFSTLLAVHVMKKLLKIEDDLSNLKFIHVPVIDLVNTVFHSLVLNGLWVWFSVDPLSDFLWHAAAMSLGDFVGSMILLLGLTVFLKFI